jgi:hypothetical protein
MYQYSILPWYSPRPLLKRWEKYHRWPTITYQYLMHRDYWRHCSPAKIWDCQSVSMRAHPQCKPGIPFNNLLDFIRSTTKVHVVVLVPKSISWCLAGSDSWYWLSFCPSLLAIFELVAAGEIFQTTVQTNWPFGKTLSQQEHIGLAGSDHCQC